MANLNGDFIPPKGAHDNRSLYSTFGKTKEMVKPKTSEYTRKGTGPNGSIRLPSGNQSKNKRKKLLIMLIKLNKFNLN